jgi:hypothetical protein
MVWFEGPARNDHQRPQQQPYQTAPATALSTTFKRPPAGLSDPDAPDGLPRSLNLALCCYKSGADETRYRLACNAVSGDGCVGSTEWNAGKQSECPELMWAEITLSRSNRHHSQLNERNTNRANRGASCCAAYSTPDRDTWDAYRVINLEAGTSNPAAAFSIAAASFSAC